MRISVASLTLRFYRRDGWTANRVSSYLVDKKRHVVTYRPDLEYFAVYDEGGYSVFIEKILENEFDNKHCRDIDFYIQDKKEEINVKKFKKGDKVQIIKMDGRRRLYRGASGKEFVGITGIISNKKSVSDGRVHVNLNVSVGICGLYLREEDVELIKKEK